MAFVGDICEAEEHWDQKGDEGSRLDTERKEVSPDGESECFEFDFVSYSYFEFLFVFTSSRIHSSHQSCPHPHPARSRTGNHSRLTNTNVYKDSFCTHKYK